MICSRPGCKNELPSPLKGPVKFCKDPACQLERKRESGRGYYRRDRKAKRVKTQLQEVKIIKKKPTPRAVWFIIPKPAAPKPKREVSKSQDIDREAPMRNWDRGTREGFRRYMEANPILFAHTFPGKTVDEAWRSLGPVTLAGFVRGGL